MANTGIWVEAPARTPLPHRLTSVVPIRPADGKSAYGVNFDVVNPEATIYPHEVCAAPSDLTTAKTFEGRVYVQDQNVVTLYAGTECGFLNFEEHAQIAREKLEAGESHALESFLRTDVFVTGTAYAPTMTTLVGKFAQAEWEALKVYQAELLVHLSPLVATLLHAAEILGMDAQGNLRTLSGSNVVVGTGYTATTAPTGGTASAAGEEWAFFTGEMLILHGDMGAYEGVDPETNKHRALAERVYSIAIDGPIIGVKLDLEA